MDWVGNEGVRGAAERTNAPRSGAVVDSSYFECLRENGNEGAADDLRQIRRRRAVARMLSCMEGMRQQ